MIRSNIFSLFAIFTLCCIFNIAYLYFATQTLAKKDSYAPEEVSYFMSIKVPKANVRTGPGVNYMIKYQIQQKHYPIKIIDSFANWRYFEDFNNETGWIHVSLLSSRKTAIFTYHQKLALYDENSILSHILLPNSIIYVEECKEYQCRISLLNDTSKSFWVLKEYIYGHNSNL